MNVLNSTAIAALLTAAIGLTAVAPAMAQNTATATTITTPAKDLQVAENGKGWGKHNQGGPRQNDAQRGPMGRDQRGGPRAPGGLMGIFNFERGSEALEIAFVRLSHDITLTDAQKPLFEDLKTTALTAQTEFADAVKAARPAADTTAAATTATSGTAATATTTTDTATATPAKPDIAEMLKTRIALETAHTKALSTVLPKLEAFVASLTDEQKASLTPQRPDRDQVGQRNGGMRHHGPGAMGPDGMMAPPAPAGDMAPPAPDAPEAPDAPVTNG